MYKGKKKDSSPFVLFPDHLLPTFFFLIHFYVQWYKFSRSVLSPLLVWSLHTSRHMQRHERRPSANQSILLTLLFIYFLSPSATAQLLLCVCVKEGWGKGLGYWYSHWRALWLKSDKCTLPIHCLYQAERKTLNIHWLLYFMVVTSSSHTGRRDRSLYFQVCI